jgi:outer membrane receptor protein involved in Fe transport
MVGVFLATVVPLQSVDAQQRLSEPGRSALDEIVVTARKREENMQDVAISMSVVSGAVLQDTGIANLLTLAPTVPNFHHAESQSGNDQIFIRGIGSGVNFGFENSVGQVLDGIFFGRARFGRSLFMDLERVEILKGPQGALVGKNTTAGVLNIITAKPTDDFQAYILPVWEFQGDEGYSVEGAVSGPLREGLRGRVAFRWDDRDGYFFNRFTNEKEMQREELYARGILEFDLSDTTKVQVLYQFGDQQRLGRHRELGQCTPAFAQLVAPFQEDCEINFTNSTVRLEQGVRLPQVTDTKSNVVAMTLNWDTDVGTLTSLTGYADYTLSDVWDSDSLSIEATTLRASESYEQVSQEIRLVSSENNTVDYIVGAFYMKSKQATRFKLDFNQNGPVPIFPVLPQPLRARDNRFTDTDTQTVAAFSELNWHLSPLWTASAGIRYTDERKTADNRKFATTLYTDEPRPQPPGGPAANSHSVSGERSVQQWSPNAVLRFRPADTAMVYASISRGFKGGGFDNQLSAPSQTIAEETFEFDDEKVTAYELGGKLRFPEVDFELSAALFKSDVTGVQVSASVNEGGGVLFKVGNAASARTQGVEIDFRWVPVERLLISGAAAYLDAKFGDYRDAPCYAAQTIAQGCVNNVQDLSGRELQYSPTWKLSVDGTYRMPLSAHLNLAMFTRLYYTGEHALALSLDPRLVQDAFLKWDASIGLSSSDDRWRLMLMGQNLTNRTTTNFGNTGAGGAGDSYFFFTAPPRSIALQGRFSF